MLQAIFLSGTTRRISTLLQVIFFFTDQCISSHSLSPCYSAHILHSDCSKNMFFSRYDILSPEENRFFLYLSEHISPC